MENLQCQFIFHLTLGEKNKFTGSLQHFLEQCTEAN